MTLDELAEMLEQAGIFMPLPWRNWGDNPFCCDNCILTQLSDMGIRDYVAVNEQVLENVRGLREGDIVKIYVAYPHHLAEKLEKLFRGRVPYTWSGELYEKFKIFLTVDENLKSYVREEED